jgi:hypothetical protein
MTKSDHLPEKEHSGPIWTHPYFIYVFFTVGLFLLLLLAAWLAWENDWIPNRRTTGG